MTMRTRNQEYAAQIFEQVKQVGEDERKKYGSLAHRLPVLIRTAGLAQALAFVEARGGAAGRKLLRDIAAVVNEVNEEKLLARSRTAELPEYMLLTRNVLAALAWYKRFAQSVLGVEAGADREGVEE